MLTDPSPSISPLRMEEIPRPQSFQHVGLPPFNLFKGSVQDQLHQAINWRQQEILKSSSSSSSSPLGASPATSSTPDNFPSQQSPTCPAPVPAVAVPHSSSPAQPTTPHHRDRHERHLESDDDDAAVVAHQQLHAPSENEGATQPASLEKDGTTQPAFLASSPTRYQPLGPERSAATTAPQPFEVQPTICQQSVNDNQDYNSATRESRLSNSQDGQNCSSTDSIVHQSNQHPYCTLQNMTDSVKVKEDSMIYRCSSTIT